MNKKQKPNFLQRVFGNFLQKSISFITMPNSPFSSGLEDFYDSYNLRHFRESLYLFIGVSMIRESVSSINLEMYEMKNQDGDVQEIFDDPFLDLIERPNYLQTQKEFWKLAIAYYLLAGEVFWYLDRPEPGATPTAMANMRPDCVRILISEDQKTVIGYNFTQPNGTIITLGIDDVLHIKNVDPINPLRGIGVIRPATTRILTEKEASHHQSMTFKNQGRPDVAVFSDQDLTEEAIEDAQARWQSKFGVDKGSQLAIFGNSMKSLQVLNTNPKDMDFMPTMKFLRDDILASLHIPKAMITSDDVNLANAQTARIIYLKEAVMPVLDVFIDIINNKFLNEMDQNRFVTYDNPVNEDRAILLAEATQLKDKGIITIDEARALMNYPSMEDGSGSVLAPGQNINAQPITMALKKMRVKKYAKTILKKRPILIKKFKAIDEYVKMLEVEKSVKRSRNPVFNTPELKNMYVKAYNDNVDNKTEVFKQTIDVYNRDFEARIIDHMTKFGINAQNFFNVSTEIVNAKKIFTPLMTNMFKKAGQETLNNVAKGFPTKASEQFHTPTEMLQALENRAEFFIKSMLNTDFNEMSALIVQGMADGKGVEEIGRDIRNFFDNMSVARARTIARTETGRLVSEATNEAYRQSALVTGKVWLTAGDDKVRDEHVENGNSDPVDPGEAFPDGEHYPGESSINCRCALAPAI